MTIFIVLIKFNVSKISLCPDLWTFDSVSDTTYREWHDIVSDTTEVWLLILAYLLQIRQSNFIWNKVWGNCICSCTGIIKFLKSTALENYLCFKREWHDIHFWKLWSPHLFWKWLWRICNALQELNTILRLYLANKYSSNTNVISWYAICVF